MIEKINEYNFKKLILDLTAYMSENKLSTVDRKIFNQILFKLQNIDVMLENIDEDLLLESIKSDYENCNIYFKSFMEGNLGYLPNISSTLDSIFQILIKYINFNLIFNNKSNIKQYLKNYKSEIAKQKNTIENETQDILNYISNKKETIEEEDSTLNSQIKEVAEGLTTLKIKQEQLEKDSNNIITNCSEKIDSSIQNESEKLNKEFESIKTDLEENYNKLLEEYEAKFDDLLSKIEQKNDKISELIGIVGEKARIGEYKKNADSSHKERIIWQYITVALFLIAFITMTIVTFASNYDKYTIIKYIVSALLMGASTYTAKQASNSRKDEIYFRKQELELASIDIYLENMEDASREEIKNVLATKMFGQAQNTYTNKYDDKKGFSAEDIAKIIDSIKNRN